MLARQILSSRYLRLFLSLVLLAGVLWHVSIGEVLKTIASVADNWIYALLSLVVPGLAVLLSVLRWRLLLSAVGVRKDVRTLYSAFLVGNFFNQFSPSTIGGDIARSWWIRSVGISGTTSMIIVAVDRLAGVLGICLVGLLAVSLQPDLIPGNYPLWIIGVFLLGVVVFIVMVGQVSFQKLLRFLVVKTPVIRSQSERLEEILSRLNILRAAPHTLIGALALSVCLQAVVIVQFTVIAKALGLDIQMAELAIVVPIVSLVTTLPVSVNGIGVREVSLAVAGAPFGLSTEGAVAIALLFLFVATIYALCGGLIYGISRR